MSELAPHRRSELPIVRRASARRSLARVAWMCTCASLLLVGACHGGGGSTAGGGDGGGMPAPVSGAPYVLYTDLASGPTSGGEHDHGTYLSIFGMNFGATGLGSTVRVRIGGVEVAEYRSLGVSLGRSDVQKITVQVGSLGGAAPGIALPIEVSVNGVASNVDHTFTPNPGRMLFVDNVHGDDASAVPGDVAHPYRHVGQTSGGNGAYDVAVPGDVIVMRGTGTPWTDVAANDTYFLRFKSKNGSAPTGSAGTGPFTLMAYPGEDVRIELPPSTGAAGGISGVDTTSYDGGRYVTIAGLHIEAGGNAGPIAVQIASDHWRIVDNELTASSGLPTAKAAGINGNGTYAYWVGNHIHAIHGSQGNLEEHGIYIDGDGSYEIAYNAIDDILGGSGMQVYVNGGNGSDVGNDVRFHHNLVHGIAKHGINVADGSQNGFEIYDNVIYDVVQAGLRFNTTLLHRAKIWNNTFARTNTNGSTYQGVITNDAVLPSDALDLRNNVFVPSSAVTPYEGGSVGLASGIGTVTNNLYFGGSGVPSFDASPVLGDPGFVSATGDFHLGPTSAAIDVGTAAVASLVTTDFDVLTLRPLGAGFDLGAYERTP